jgi:Membrane protein involved in the export of O-antigen and teichoic acid
MIKLNGFHRLSLIKDVVALYALSVVNLLIPVLFFPYISSVVGLKQFGIFVVISSLYQYGSLVVEFGTTAPMVRLFSMVDNGDLSSDFWGLILFRLLLAVIMLLVLAVIYFFYFNGNEYLVVVFGSLSLIGTAINPLSIFQARNKLPISSSVTVFVRLLVLGLTMYLLTEVKTLSILFFYQCMPIFIISLILFFMAINYKYIMVCSPRSFIKNKLLFNEAASFTLGAFFSSGYTLTIPIIINAYFGDYYAGMYGVIDRVVQPIKQILMPLINVFYPKVCTLVSLNKKEAVSFILKTIGFISSGCFLVVVVGLCFNKLISFYIFRGGVGVEYIIPFWINILFVYWSQLLLFLYVIPYGKIIILKKIYLFMFLMFVIFAFFSVYLGAILFFYWGLSAVEGVGCLLFCFLFLSDIKNH